jgi:hypothetical protein
MRAVVLFSINQGMCGLCRDRRRLDTVEGSLEVHRIDNGTFKLTGVKFGKWLRWYINVPGILFPVP